MVLKTITQLKYGLYDVSVELNHAGDRAGVVRTATFGDSFIDSTHARL